MSFRRARTRFCLVVLYHRSANKTTRMGEKPTATSKEAGALGGAVGQSRNERRSHLDDFIIPPFHILPSGLCIPATLPVDRRERLR